MDLMSRPAKDVGTEAGAPPHVLLWDLATRAFVARSLHVVAALGVADALAPDGGDVAELAATLDVDADALARIIRLLAAHGVFEADLPAVRHTEASLLLRRDHPMSMGAFAHMMGLPLSWGSLSALPNTVQTGRAGIYELDPGGLFAYLNDHPDQGAVFDGAMRSKSAADVMCLLDAYDFGAHRTVADVGGGLGILIDAITARHPATSGILVELPEVITRVTDAGTTGDRVQLVAADFFRDELPTADAYVLMEIIHDWDDADAVKILANIRRNAAEGAVVLLAETVLDDAPGPDLAKRLDVIMLAVTGGRERTPSQYAALFAAAGLELTGITRTAGSVNIVEARVS